MGIGGGRQNSTACVDLNLKLCLRAFLWTKEESRMAKKIYLNYRKEEKTGQGTGKFIKTDGIAIALIIWR